MITAITGKPGSGKSLYSTQLLIKYLVEDTRTVITNISINLPVLNEYIQRQYPNAFVDLGNRLIVLTEPEDIRLFYRFRALRFQLDEPSELLDSAGKKLRVDKYIEAVKAWFACIPPEYSSGCIYFIDEAHDYFSARDWANMSNLATFYFTKHRHLSDEVFLITQALPQLDKQLRNLIGTYHVIENRYLQKFAGIFKKPRSFRKLSYYDNPTPLIDPYERTTFKLDISGIASCYSTTGALGVVTVPPKPPTVRGLPYWSIFLFAFLIFIVFVFGLFSFNKLLLPRIIKSSGFSKKVEQTSAGNNSSGNSSGNNSSRNNSSGNNNSATLGNYYTSCTLFGDLFRVVLDTGDELYLHKSLLVPGTFPPVINYDSKLIYFKRKDKELSPPPISAPNIPFVSL